MTSPNANEKEELGKVVADKVDEPVKDLCKVIAGNADEPVEDLDWVVANNVDKPAEGATEVRFLLPYSSIYVLSWVVWFSCSLALFFGDQWLRSLIFNSLSF